MKILLVEDDFIIAMHLQSLLEGEGYEVLGPCATSREALEVLAKEEVAFALLDYSLADGGTSLTVAEQLQSRGCSFAFVTGLGGGTKIPDRFSDAPRLTKPIQDVDLRTTLADFHKS
jgi:CheY-like chemotaxis protein